MIIPEQIDNVVSWDGLREFTSFVLSYCEDGNLPDYKKMDLMKIPHLVPYIWVYDLRDDEKKKGLLINFCGQKHDERYGHNAMGKYDADYLRDNPLFDSIMAFYAKSIDQKQIAFTKQSMSHALSTGKIIWRDMELIFFPCSSDGKTVNWGIGCHNFELKPTRDVGAFHHFEYP